MYALLIHNLTVVDDKAVAADGTRSPTTRTMATRTFGRYVLRMSSSFIRNSNVIVRTRSPSRSTIASTYR